MTIEQIVDLVQKSNVIECRELFDALALCGEAGELANKIKKRKFYPDRQVDDEDIVDELSDVLFHVVSLAMHYNFTLSELEEYAIAKQNRRLR